MENNNDNNKYILPLHELLSPKLTGFALLQSLILVF